MKTPLFYIGKALSHAHFTSIFFILKDGFWKIVVYKQDTIHSLHSYHPIISINLLIQKFPQKIRYIEFVVPAIYILSCFFG